MATRVLAAVIVLIVIVYWVLRVMASGCGGSACDWYIPFSLLLPVSALILAAVAGGMAAYAARASRAWTLALAACAVLGAAGPIVAGFLIQGHNDALVVLSTVLVLSVPVAVGLKTLPTRARIG